MAKQTSKNPASKKRQPARAKAAATTPKQTSKKSAEASKSYPSKAATHETAAAPAALRKLPSPFRLLKTSLRVLKHRWKLFAGILGIYVVLNFLFVQTLAGLDVSNVKTSLDQLFQGKNGKFSSATALFSYLLSTSGSTSSDGAVYQVLFLLIVSMALIRALREVYDNRLPRIRDVFYEGMFPLVPFVLVLLFVGVELIPLTLGATLYATVLNGGIAVYWYEDVIWTIVFAGFALVTLYLIASSLMALYISTQPAMTPIRAIRAANKVTHGRRTQIILRLLFLPLVMFVVAAVIMMPIILAVPAAASVVAFVLMVLGIVVVHSYLFALLRSVLA